MAKVLKHYASLHMHSTHSDGVYTPKELVEMTRVFGFPPFMRLKKLYLPSVLPYFTAGFKTSLGLAWKAGVAAEVLAFPKNSIGKQLYEAAIALAKENSCYNLTLNVWSCNKSALKFYESQGLLPQKIGMELVL